MCSGPFPFASQYCAESRMLTMRQNKNKIQTNCAWNGYRTHGWLREFIGSRVASAAWIDVYIYVSHLKFAQKPWQKIELPKTTTATWRLPQWKQNNKRDAKQKGRKKEENKSWGQNKKERKVKWKSASPKGISPADCYFFYSTCSALHYPALPCPAAPLPHQPH